MEKSSSMELDLADWEFLDDQNGFLGFCHDSEKSIISGELKLVDVNYFICPAKEETSEEVQAKAFKDIGAIPPVILSGGDAAVSRVFFNNLKTNQLADMKMKSSPVQEEAEEKVFNMCEYLEDQKTNEKEEKMEKNMEQTKGKPRWERIGISIWRWRIPGIGALCSIGVAAATICIFILGGPQKRKQHHQSRQKLQFQIYTDGKRMKEVVQQASRLNQALSTMSRAHISFGGYYDGL